MGFGTEGKISQPGIAEVKPSTVSTTVVGAIGGDRGGQPEYSIVKVNASSGPAPSESDRMARAMKALGREAPEPGDLHAPTQKITTTLRDASGKALNSTEAKPTPKPVEAKPEPKAEPTEIDADYREQNRQKMEELKARARAKKAERRVEEQRAEMRRDPAFQNY